MKRHIPLFYTLIIALIIGFIVQVLIDWRNYGDYISQGGSAPFITFVIVDAVMFLVFAIILIAIKLFV